MKEKNIKYLMWFFIVSLLLIDINRKALSKEWKSKEVADYHINFILLLFLIDAISFNINPLLPPNYLVYLPIRFIFLVITFVSVYFCVLLAQASVCLSREIVGGTLEFCADGPPVLPKKIWPMFFSLCIFTNFISLVTILEFGYGVFD